jgi:hypothetical protein
MKQAYKTLLSLGILTLLAGAFGLYAYFGAYKKDETEKKQKDHDARLFTPYKLDEKTVDGGVPKIEFLKLAVTVDGKPTMLERVPGQDWMLVSPVHAKADKLVLDAIVSHMQTAQFKSTLDENPTAESLKTYGLDNPKFIIEAESEVAPMADNMKSESRKVMLKGGIENTFDGSIFMQRNNEKTVHTAEGGSRYTLSKNTFDLREKQILAIDEKKIQSFSVKSTVNNYALEKNAEKQWTLTKPSTELADSNTVAAMLSQFGSERAQEFFDPSEAKSKGFETPFVDANFVLDSGDKVRIRLMREVKDAGAADVFALREEANLSELARFPGSALQLDKNTEDLKDKTIVRFKKEAVVKMVFYNADRTEIVLAKDSPDASAEAWKVMSPVQGKAQIFKVTSILWTLSTFKAQSLGERNPKDWSKYGIKNSSRHIALFDLNGEIARFTFGDLVPGKPNTYFVRGTNNTVVESDGSRFSEFPTGVEGLLEMVPDAGSSFADSGK